MVAAEDSASLAVLGWKERQSLQALGPQRRPYSLPLGRGWGQGWEGGSRSEGSGEREQGAHLGVKDRAFWTWPGAVSVLLGAEQGGGGLGGRKG